MKDASKTFLDSLRYIMPCFFEYLVWFFVKGKKELQKPNPDEHLEIHRLFVDQNNYLDLTPLRLINLVTTSFVMIEEERHEEVQEIEQMFATLNKILRENEGNKHPHLVRVK